MAQSSWVLCLRSHSIKWWIREISLTHVTASNSFHYSFLPCLSLNPVCPTLLCRPDHICANLPLPTGHKLLLMLWVCGQPFGAQFAGCFSCQSTRYSQGNPNISSSPPYKPFVPHSCNKQSFNPSSGPGYSRSCCAIPASLSEGFQLWHCFILFPLSFSKTQINNLFYLLFSLASSLQGPAYTCLVLSLLLANNPIPAENKY